MIDEPERRAERRVRVILARIARHGIPAAPVALVGDPACREAARQLAERRAAEATRDAMLADARRRLQALLDAQLSEMSIGAGFGSGSLPFSAEERAAAACALNDLLTAAVVEDLVQSSVTEVLSTGGERLLRSASGGSRRDFHWDAIAEGGPIDPLAAPWAMAQLVGGTIGALIVSPIALLFAWHQGGTVAGIVAAVVTAVAFLSWATWPRWRTRRRRHRFGRRIDP